MSYKVPNHTQTPNELFDIHMRDMDMAELKVTLVICRKTFGWHKQRDKISLSQLEEITGMSRTSVIKGVQQGIGRGTIERFACDDGFEYGLVTEGDSTENVPQKPQSSTESVHTKESIKEKVHAKDFDSLAASKKPISFSDYPPDVQVSLLIFQKHFPKIKVDSKAKWIKQARVWGKMGLTSNDIGKMCEYAKDNWNVAQPSSITSAYNMMQTKNEYDAVAERARSEAK